MNSQKPKSKAFTLIEVLVAMLVLAIGLLGLAGITVVVLRSNVLSQQISEATTITADLMERLKQVSFDELPDCGLGNEISLSGSCRIIEESGLEEKGELFYPSSIGASNCVIDSDLTPIKNAIGGENSVYDIVNSRIEAEAAPSGDFCSAFNNLPIGRYVRYYRIYAPSGTTSQRVIVVVTLWKDRFGKWRQINLTTTRSQSGS